jgi:hypothetical protein
MGSTCTRTRIARSAWALLRFIKNVSSSVRKKSKQIRVCIIVARRSNPHRYKKLVRPRRKVWRSGVKGFLIEKDHHGPLSRASLFVGRLLCFVSPSALFLRFLDSNETRCPRALQIGSEYLSSGCCYYKHTRWMDGWMDI